MFFAVHHWVMPLPLAGWVAPIVGTVAAIGTYLNTGASGTFIRIGNWDFFWLPAGTYRRFFNYGTFRGTTLHARWWRLGRLEMYRKRPTG